ncbi:MAG TPA: hypothetical protein VN381_12205 [Anaerovoracaceae bacterium]|nr:hypothetical protein [Anaerovoracaceae bacterium]
MVNISQINVTVPQELKYTVTYEQMNILLTFQKLWTQISIWLRSVLVATLYDLPNREAVINEVFNTTLSFYNIFRLFYGVNIATQFYNMLNRYVTTAWRLIEAFVENNQGDIDSNTVQLYQIADEMAVFLSPLNIHWSENQWRYLLNQFTNLFISEIIAMLQGNYTQEIAIFNRLDDITDIIGSYMARGILSSEPAPGSR